jgi:hypothetical protein
MKSPREAEIKQTCDVLFKVEQTEHGKLHIESTIDEAAFQRFWKRLWIVAAAAAGGGGVAILRHLGIL